MLKIFQIHRWHFSEINIDTGPQVTTSKEQISAQHLIELH